MSIVNWLTVVYCPNQLQTKGKNLQVLAAVQPGCSGPLPDRSQTNVLKIFPGCRSSNNSVFELKIEGMLESGLSDNGHSLTRVCNHCCTLFLFRSSLDCLIQKLFLLFCYFKLWLLSNMTWLISLVNIYFLPLFQRSTKSSFETIMRQGCPDKVLPFIRVSLRVILVLARLPALWCLSFDDISLECCHCWN